jgi:hypothetical protein
MNIYTEDYGNIDVDFSIEWTIEDGEWTMGTVDIKDFYPTIVDYGTIKGLLDNVIEELNFNPLTPYRGEEDTYDTLPSGAD